MYGSLSQFFHENTKLTADLSPSNPNEPLFPFYKEAVETIHFKSYPRFQALKLEKGPRVQQPCMQRIIRNIKPVEKFTAQSITRTEVSEILFYSAGIAYHEKVGGETFWDNTRRPYPSIGACHPLELYPVIFRGLGLDPGVYHYNVKTDSLELMMKGDYTNQLVHAIPNQDWIKNASMVICISAIFKRTETQHSDRGYRYVLLEAGHVAQNIYLLAASMGLGCCTVGVYLDDEINQLLDLDGLYESVIHVVVVGGIKTRLLDRVRRFRRG